MSAGYRKDARLQLGHAFVGYRNYGNHRATQLVAQALRVQKDAPVARHVHHVQGQDQWYAHLQELNRKIEVALEVGGVDDVDDQIRVRG